MNPANPTRLRIGMHGMFSGIDYRLTGRVVMGVTVEDEEYFWNEFNLESRTGKSATLVFEQTERGDVWRLFTLFEPEYPLTAEDAATKRVGDHLNLTGVDVRVTLRENSRVNSIEGKAPDGVAVGDVAEYFNAEARGVMQVVSWTGDEVEFYNGVNVSAGVVNSAFNLPFQAANPAGIGRFFSALTSSSSSENYSSGRKFILQTALVAVALGFTFFGPSFSCTSNRESAPVQKFFASKPPLAVGAAGKMKDKNYHITGHAVVEMAETGFIRERHEYELKDDLGQTAVLVCGAKPGDKNWTLFTTLMPLVPPSAQECAAKKMGEIVNVDGVVGPIREIFQSTVRQADGATSGALVNGRACFGYLAQGEYRSLLVRWDNAAIYFFAGIKIPADEARVALSSPGWK